MEEEMVVVRVRVLGAVGCCWRRKRLLDVLIFRERERELQRL